MTMRRPIILGIVGDSAAGKTTITKGLATILGADRVTHICTDDYHRYDRRERAALGVTPLHPDSNYIDVLEQHMERLRFGEPILKPVYEHATGSLVRPEYVQPRQFVIVEGLLGFSTPMLRAFYDVKVFLNPPEEMRTTWKIKRDTTKRGYTTAQVLDELARRELDSRTYIHTQREHADIVVAFRPPHGVAPEDAGANLNACLVLRPTIPHPDLSYLVAKGGASPGLRLTLARDQGRPVDLLEIDGDVAAAHAAGKTRNRWSTARPRGSAGEFARRARRTAAAAKAMPHARLETTATRAGLAPRTARTRLTTARYRSDVVP